MKKVLQLMFCAGVLAALLAGTALAAGTSTAGYTTANDNCTVTYNTETGKYTAAYNGADLVNGNQYVLLVVKGTETDYSVGENTIMYIDQKAATESGISFDFIPKSTPDCVVLLGGVFTDATSPKILGTLSGQGVTVSGSVTSYNPNAAVTVELYATGTTANPAYTTTIAAASGSGQVTQSFAFTSVAEGTYDLKVTKAGHTAYWVTGIPVGTDDVILESAVTMVCGDINGDGKVNANDLVLLTSSANYNKSTEESSVPASDINGDGKINANDLVLLTSKANYNQGEISIVYGG